MISSAGMRMLEEYAASIGIDDAVMMENAGSNAASILDSVIELKGKNVLVFCGTGNNCGDGLTFSRHALIKGASVTVFLVKGEESMKPLPKKNLSALSSLSSRGAPVSVIDSLPEGTTADILVDAMLGTGICGNPDQVYTDAIRRFNSMGGTKVSLDCPSGMDADTGKCPGACAVPDITITFYDCKIGLSKKNSGHIVVAGIGIPLLPE